MGLIAGNGKFPMAFAKQAKAQGYQVIAAGVKGDTSFLLRPFVHKIKFFHVGSLRSMFEYFRESGVKQAIMAGQVDPNNLFKKDLQLDDTFRELFDAIKDRKTDTIFGAVADKLKEYGIELIDSTFLLKDYLAKPGALTDREPSPSEKEDAEFGRVIAKLMGGIDVGQTVVVKDKAIVAIEAMEGTDKTIIRGGKIAKEGAVIIKMSKPAQDLRFDVPVIGPRTIRSMIRSKCKCLIIDSGKTIIIDQPFVKKLADRAGISIFAI